MAGGLLWGSGQGKGTRRGFGPWPEGGAVDSARSGHAQQARGHAPVGPSAQTPSMPDFHFRNVYLQPAAMKHLPTLHSPQ
jgi:hypothetical protein